MWTSQCLVKMLLYIIMHTLKVNHEGFLSLSGDERESNADNL